MSEEILKELPRSWKEPIKNNLSAPDLDKLKELEAFLKAQEKSRTIYPPKHKRYEALHLCPLEKTKVVILGQDPYHGEGQAMGLSFSVPKNVKLPPSLKNIFKELQEDLKQSPPEHGDLTHWAKQGVLLLNSVLTVEKSSAGSHQKKGWEVLTKAILETLNAQKNLVFILWGGPAQKMAKSIDEHGHLILKSVHPSPLSSYRGFFGSRPFSKANKYLESHGIVPIRWV